jgi:hypothetical protein
MAQYGNVIAGEHIEKCDYDGYMRLEIASSKSGHDAVESRRFGLVICAFVKQFVQTITVVAQFMAPVVV